RTAIFMTLSSSGLLVPPRPSTYSTHGPVVGPCGSRYRQPEVIDGHDGRPVRGGAAVRHDGGGAELPGRCPPARGDPGGREQGGGPARAGPGGSPAEPHLPHG